MIGLIVGLLSAILPQGLKFWQDSKDKKHELKLLEMQMQAQSQGHTERREEINAQADIKSDEAVYAAYKPMSQYPQTGIKWIDGVGALLVIGINALNSSVRPAIAYIFTGFYIYNRPNTWSSVDSDILFLVLGHFFGNRAMRYVFGAKK